MAYPVCRLHPRAQVRRDGCYGKRKEFARLDVCAPLRRSVAHWSTPSPSGPSAGARTPSPSPRAEAKPPWPKFVVGARR
jgi:hypothetical protein